MMLSVLLVLVSTSAAHARYHISYYPIDIDPYIGVGDLRLQEAAVTSGYDFECDSAINIKAQIDSLLHKAKVAEAAIDRGAMRMRISFRDSTIFEVDNKAVCVYSGRTYSESTKNIKKFVHHLLRLAGY